MTDRAALSIPARAPDVAVARSFAAASLRALGVGEDEVDAVRVAVSELVSAAIDADAGGIEVGVVAGHGDGVTVSVSPDGPVPPLDELRASIVSAAGTLTTAADGWVLGLAGR